MNKGFIFLSFIAGAATGALVAVKMLDNKYKEKYERILEEDLESFRKAIANRAYVVKDDDCDDVAEPGIEYASTIVREGYTDGEIEYIQNPYVIAPEELGENEEYDIETLIYYADEKLTDDDNRLVEDVENLVGVASLSRFGEYENDSVCVRNDRLKTDYEILLDVRRYSDVVDDPHQAED